MLRSWRKSLRRRVVAVLVKSPILIEVLLAFRSWIFRLPNSKGEAVAEPEASGAFSALLATTDFVAIDVGAAHWLPHHWRPYENVFEFVLVEPDGAACEELRNRAARLSGARERYEIVQAALSGTGGVRSFFRFNQPTGSSMLEPTVLEEDDRALFDFPSVIDNSDYVFPIAETQIETITLSQVLARTDRRAFHMIKLDTQGTELEIVRGFGESLKDVALVQMEVGDHKLYRGKPGLAEAIEYMNKEGFRLFDVQLARDEMPLRGAKQHGYSTTLFPSSPDRDSAFVARLWEVDAVFVRDPVPVLQRRDANMLRRIIVALCVYRLFGEAYQLTGMGEMKGLWSGLTASRYRRDVLNCHHALKRRLDQGYRLFWERL